MADSIAPRQVALLFVNAIKHRMGVPAKVCALGAYVEGMSVPKFVQVVTGGTQPDGMGEGYQDGGGALVRSDTITLWCYFTMKYSMHQITQEELTRESEGILDWMERLRALFSATTLGGVTIERIYWRGTGAVGVADPDKGVLFCTMTLRAKIGEELPSAASLSANDLLP